MKDTKKLSTEWDKRFSNVFELSKYAANHTIEIKDSTIQGYDISKAKINIMMMTNTTWDNVTARLLDANLVAFKGGTLTKVNFAQSNIKSMTFEDVLIEDVGFVGSNITNLTFKKCKIARSRIRNLKKSQVTFINTQVLDSEFFDSEVIFKAEHSSFDLAQAQHGTFENLQPGSSIELIDTSLNDANVGGTLTSFKAKGGSIIKVGIGENIKDVVFDGVELEMSMGGVIDSLTVKDSKITRMGIGEMKINHLTVEDCQPSNLLSLARGQYNTVEINNCTLQTFKPRRLTANEFTLRNSQFDNTLMHNSNINQLNFKNVTFKNARFDNTIAKESNINGVKLIEGGVFNLSGTNIPLQ